jgi:multidrug efflux pump subunit AcrA (membrane-fusion protein)
MKRWILLSLLAAGCDVAAEESPWPESPTDARARLPDPPAPASAPVLGLVVPARTVDLVARVEGTIEALPLEVGDDVENGTCVAELDDAALPHRTAHTRAQARDAKVEIKRQNDRRRWARKELERLESAASYLPHEELDRAARAVGEAEHALAQSKARARAARETLAAQQVDMNNLEVESTIEGTLAQYHHNVGARVHAGTPVARVVSRESRLRFLVPPAVATRLQPGTPVTFTGQGTDREYATHVGSVAPVVDAAGLVLIEARFTGDAPRQGLGGEVRLPAP